MTGAMGRSRFSSTRIAIAVAIAAIAAAAMIISTAGTAIAAGGSAQSSSKRHGHHHKHKAKRAKVKLKITTGSQKAMLKQGGIKVRLKARGRTKVRLKATFKRHGNYFKKRSVRFKKNRKQVKRVKLRLTKRGRKKLATCGAKKVKVTGTYRVRARGKKGSRGKKARARAGKRLKRDKSLCGSHPGPPAPPAPPNPPAPPKPKPKPDPETVAGCDPANATVAMQDPDACMLPYPNDYYTKADPSTDTGRRLDFKPGKMPVNLNGVSTYSSAFNRNDGFSPNNIIDIKVPGLQGPGAFRANKLVSQLNIGAYDDPDQKLVLIDAATHERVPIWAEIDMVPGTPNPHDNGNVPGSKSDRMLLIHPAQSLEYGHRYVVALRDLVGPGGNLQPGEVFKDYRDKVVTANPQVESWRPHMENKVFAPLKAAGIARGNLYAAWDFTVASKHNLTERVLDMREDAFDQLGDDDLTDGKAVGQAPQINNVHETLYAPCAADANCDLTADPPQSRYAYKKVTGTITVPCYMNAPGADYDPVLPDTPCAPGSRLNFASATDNTPEQNGTWEAPFTCIVPRTAPNGPAKTTGNKAIVFGHGLFQNNETTEQLGLYPASMQGVACGTDWIGLSATNLKGEVLPDGDLAAFLIPMITGAKNLGLFSALPDRTQQGYINFLYLARAMDAPCGAGGFRDLPEFRVADSGGTADECPNEGGDGKMSVYSMDSDDTAKDLAYYGVSLGGINGAATTAIAPDWQRATVGVPGMGFTTLLLRSTQFNQFLPYIYAAYPDSLSRQLGVSMLQILWDRGEPSAYSHDILDGGLGTPPHKLLIQESFGDHQVTNIQTAALARTVGATLRVPGAGATPDSPIAAGRIEDLSTIADPAGRYLFTPMDDLHPYWNIPTATSEQFNQPGGLPNEDAAMIVVDTGEVRPSGGVGFVGTSANQDWNIAPVSGTATAPNDGLDPHQPGATSPASQQALLPFLLDEGYYDPCGDGYSNLSGVQLPPFIVPYSSDDPVACTAPPSDYIGNGH